MKELPAILKERTAHAGERMALATIVKTVGSSYRRPGAHMLIRENGQTVGSISGGCLEQDVIAHGQKVCASGETKLLSYDTTSEEDVTFGVGLGCKGVIEILMEPFDRAAFYLDRIEEIFQKEEPAVIATIFRAADQTRVGERIALNDANVQEALRARRSTSIAFDSIEVFLEVILPPPSLFIFGAGYDAIPLARMAKDLGFCVNVIDRRPAYATRDRFPDAESVRILEPSALAELHLNERAAAVVMAHHYNTDRDFLRALAPLPLRYLGVMGPRRRAEKMLQEFRDEDLFIGDEFLQKLHNPIGLDIGAEGPDQIALAILSEIQAVFAGHSGGLLRERKGPIHSPRTALP